MGARLEVRGLEVRFPGPSGSVVALRGLDLVVAAGSRHGLVGASGSGKSVTALAILGLLPAGGRRTAGSVAVDGRSLEGLDETALREVRGRVVGYVPQDPTASLHPSSRVDTLLVETLRTHHRLGRDEARDEAASRLREAGLESPRSILARYPNELSGGQRQRVLLALGLAGDPSLLIADEPTSSLDPISAGRVLSALRGVCASRAMTLLLISHDLASVAAVCDSVSILSRGRVVEAGETPHLLGAATTPVARELVRAARALGARS